MNFNSFGNLEKIPGRQNPQEILVPEFVKIEFKEASEEDFILQREELMNKYPSLSLRETTKLVYYLQHLGLAPEELRNKNVLDVGSGVGIFKDAIQKVTEPKLVVNLDDGSVENITDKDMEVKARADKLPFKNEIFDYVLAHCSVPMMQITTSRTPHLVPVALREMVRVLKRGGVAKIYPGIIDTREKVNSVSAEFIIMYKRMNDQVVAEIDRLHQENKNLKFKLEQTLIKGDTGVIAKAYNLLEIYKN